MNTTGLGVEQEIASFFSAKIMIAHDGSMGRTVYLPTNLP